MGGEKRNFQNETQSLLRNTQNHYKLKSPQTTTITTFSSFITSSTMPCTNSATTNSLIETTAVTTVSALNGDTSTESNQDRIVVIIVIFTCGLFLSLDIGLLWIVFVTLLLAFSIMYATFEYLHSRNNSSSAPGTILNVVSVFKLISTKIANQFQKYK